MRGYFREDSTFDGHWQLKWLKSWLDPADLFGWIQGYFFGQGIRFTGSFVYAFSFYKLSKKDPDHQEEIQKIVQHQLVDQDTWDRYTYVYFKQALELQLEHLEIYDNNISTGFDFENEADLGCVAIRCFRNNLDVLCFRISLDSNNFTLGRFIFSFEDVEYHYVLGLGCKPN